MARKATPPLLSSLNQTDVKIETRILSSDKTAAVVTLNGYISPAGGAALQDVLNKLEEEGVYLFLMDMRAVTRICSAGIALLVAFRTRKSIEAPTRRGQGSEPFVLISPSSEIQFVMRELGISDLFPTFLDQSAAFSALGLKE